MSGVLISTSAPVPSHAPVEFAHAANFEQFDGLDVPNHDNRTHPNQFGAGQGWRSPRDFGNTPIAEQTYTPGPLRGIASVLGGQPLPVANWLYRVGRGYTASRTPSVQHRMGAGQAYQGVAQTAALSEITNTPPIPGDISSIIAGWG